VDMSGSSKTAVELLDDLIWELEVATSEKLPKEPSEKVAKQQGKKKGEGRPVKVEPKYPPKDVDTLHALNLRVGVITSVKKHETADKLYCEEIDIGEEDGPRAIASGLVPHYTLEEMQNKRLIVVANLKPKNLVGFKSYGMVLCAAKLKDDGTETVEFVDPPADAPIGARVIAEGMEMYDPLTGAQVDKQKIFEKVAGVLRTNEETGEAEYKGAKLVVEGSGGGVCKAPTVKGGFIR
jgi:aminoacyl tRNA synthase complex-interacting multifunctional protein 1